MFQEASLSSNREQPAPSLGEGISPTPNQGQTDALEELHLPSPAIDTDQRAENSRQEALHATEKVSDKEPAHSFSNTLAGHYAGRMLLSLSARLSYLPFTGTRFTGYWGEEWTEEKFERVVKKEGLYSQALLGYAQAKGIEPAEAKEHLLYLKETPREILTALLVNHCWEQLPESSPYVATSRNVRTAAFHGPFSRTLHGDIFSAQRPDTPSVIFVTKNNEETRVSRELGDYSNVRSQLNRLFDALCMTEEYLAEELDYNRKKGSKEGLEKFEAILALREWMKEHRYLSDLCLGQRFDPPKIKSEKEARSALFTMLKDANSAWDWHASEMRKMARKEAEEVVLLYLPAENIVAATLYDEGKKVVRKYIA